MIGAWRAVLVLGALAGCGSGSRPAAHRDAGTGSAAAAAAPVDLARVPLGAARLDGFAWRSRPGHDAYRAAVTAEKAARWADVVTACRRALGLDPDHLEAAWLEAAALAREGNTEAVLAPLQVAAAGDWGKWGERSLELELFGGFRATPVGQAWARTADGYRDDYAAALGRAVIIGARGDLHGYDPQTGRWLRVTRTFGAVRAAVALEPAHLIAYVAVRKARGGGKAVTVGVVDLSTARPAQEVAVSGDKLELRFRDAKGEPALEVADGKRGVWARIDWRDGTRAASDAKGAVLSATLVMAGDTTRLRRPPGKDVTADWDDQGAAGAMRIERSRRTVTAPGTLLFDANTLVWSPDRARIAVVAAPADPCAAEDREVAVIDVDTGRLRSIDHGPTPAQLAWLASGELAVARGGLVLLYGVDGAPGATLAADEPLWLGIRPAKPACATAPEPTPEPEPIPDPEPEPDPEVVGTYVPEVAPAQGVTRDAGATVSTPADAGR